MVVCMELPNGSVAWSYQMVVCMEPLPNGSVHGVPYQMVVCMEPLPNGS